MMQALRREASSASGANRYAAAPFATDDRERELHALLARMVGGDQSALRVFYARLNRLIYSFALQRLSCELLAEEVVVETLYETWRSAGRFEGRSKVSTWVLGIAHHKAMDKLRALVTDARRLVPLDEETEELPSPQPHSYEQLLQRQQARHLRDCMAALSEVQREAIYLVFYEDKSIAEVAARQNCPENTVKTRLFHARRKMRALLEQQTRLQLVS